jgi:6-phosphogluconolactonase/glucosamine-6-phosphate isomerase/deaminase
VERLTITPSVIAAARAVFILVAGRDKAAMVAQAIDGVDDPVRLPVQFARHGTWLLDEEAASQLHQTEG